MKIACVYPDTPQRPKFQWVHDALEGLGHGVHQVRTPDELCEADQACELCLFFHKGAGIGVQNLLDLAPGHKSYWVQWWFDLFGLKPGPLSGQPYLHTFGKLLLEFDLVLMKERKLIPQFNELGITAEYMDQGCPANFPPVQKHLPKWDVLVWGNACDYGTRVKDALFLAEKFNVLWIGADAKINGIQQMTCVHPEKLWEFASQSRYVLSVDRRHDVAGYWSDRFWMATGMGSCVLTRETQGRPEGPYLTYRTHEELLGLVDEHWDDYYELGQEARKWVMSQHTIGHRCQELLQRVSTATAAAR